MKQTKTSTLVLALSTLNYVLTLICCSFFVPLVIEGVLSDLPMLEHNNVLLSRRAPLGQAHLRPTTTGNCAASIGFLTSVGNFEKPLKEPQLSSAK
jgi:hypothetical protein